LAGHPLLSGRLRTASRGAPSARHSPPGAPALSLASGNQPSTRPHRRRLETIPCSSSRASGRVWRGRLPLGESGIGSRRCVAPQCVVWM